MSTSKSDSGNISAVGDALRTFRKAKGMTQGDVGSILGITKGYVSKLESGEKEPSILLEKAIRQLVGGKEWLPNVSPGPSLENAHKIPIISWVQAGDWMEVFDPFQPGYADEWVDTSETSHQNAFALRVQGDSMEPEFTEGEIVVVDPGLEVVSGDYVIAKNGEEAIFKQFIVDGGSVYRKPLNKRYPIKDMTGIEMKIVGVVVEKKKRYRRL